MPLLSLPFDAPPVIASTRAASLAPRGKSSDGETRQRVRSLLSLMYPQGQVIERRREQRYPFPMLISLTPLAPQGPAPAGPPMVVVGKHLSECGLGFYHPAPLPYRRVLATIEGAGGRSERFVLDLSWCRFLRQGWYESGGKFLECPPPDESPEQPAAPSALRLPLARLGAAGTQAPAR